MMSTDLDTRSSVLTLTARDTEVAGRVLYALVCRITSGDLNSSVGFIPLDTLVPGVVVTGMAIDKPWGLFVSRPDVKM